MIFIAFLVGMVYVAMVGYTEADPT